MRAMPCIRPRRSIPSRDVACTVCAGVPGIPASLHVSGALKTTSGLLNWQIVAPSAVPFTGVTHVAPELDVAATRAKGRRLAISAVPTTRTLAASKPRLATLRVTVCHCAGVKTPHEAEGLDAVNAGW